jgi:hypothetical protein
MTWKARFVEMRFDQFESTVWERLVASGMAKDDATSEMVRRRELAAATPPCGYCGSLGWTVREYGRVTHKQLCPHRTDPWHQANPHPEENHGPND